MITPAPESQHKMRHWYLSILWLLLGLHNISRCIILDLSYRAGLLSMPLADELMAEQLVMGACCISIAIAVFKHAANLYTELLALPLSLLIFSLAWTFFCLLQGKGWNLEYWWMADYLILLLLIPTYRYQKSIKRVVNSRILIAEVLIFNLAILLLYNYL